MGSPCRELCSAERKVKPAHTRPRLRTDKPPAHATEMHSRSGQPNFLLYRIALALDRIGNREVEPQVSVRQGQLRFIPYCSGRLTRTTPIYPPRRPRTGNQTPGSDEL